jgi:hypothetical protein
MKLGVSYIVFDGIELLEKSIEQIRNFSDYVQVIYQNESWFGEKLCEKDMDFLRTLERKKIVDELSLFSRFEVLKYKTSSSIMKSKAYELKKRQFGLNSCLIQNCTHYLCLDVDEFYISKEFKNAKEKIIKNDYSQTATHFINYVNLPTIHRGFDVKKVPFICKINKETKMSSSFFVKCDKTRGIKETKTSSKHLFDKTEIFMHHMESVRKNLFLKYNSTTRKVFNREKTKELINKIKKINNQSKKINFEKIIYSKLNEVDLYTCENIFNIHF